MIIPALKLNKRKVRDHSCVSPFYNTNKFRIGHILVGDIHEEFGRENQFPIIVAPDQDQGCVAFGCTIFTFDELKSFRRPRFGSYLMQTGRYRRYGITPAVWRKLSKQVVAHLKRLKFLPVKEGA